MTSSLDTIMKYIRADSRGTLIVILGRTGCGKSTLALKLMREINGSDEISFLTTQSDLIRLESRHGICMRSHMAERYALLDKDYVERTCGLASMGYVPILIATDLNEVPRQHRGPSEKGLSGVLVIQFGGERGAYKAIYSMRRDDHELKTLKTSGKVTQEDVDMVQRMAEKMRDIRWSVRA